MSGSVPGAGAAATPPRLLERDSYLESLEAWWADVASGHGRLVLVAGEAGIGKTALVRDFCDRRCPRARVLWGGCDGLRTPRPLAPFVDIAAVTGGAFAETVARGERPAGIFAALCDEVAAAQPTIVVIEDLHWADEATLDVVTMLGRRAETVPALVVATYRDDELAADHPLRSVLGELRAGSGVRRLALAPLSLGGVEALTTAAGFDTARLYRVTAGNPFFVTEVLAAGGEDIPATVRDAVLARAGRLSSDARRLLEATAVVPGRVDLSLLEALASDLIEQLEECVASGVLTAGRADVAFRHELARVAIEDSIPPNRRVALHRAALAALEARGGDSPDSARLADHAEAASDQEGVLRWAPEAAERAARGGSHREAAAQLARALRFGDGLPVNRRAELLQRRVDECWMTDQFDAAIEAQEEALECWRRLGDRLGEGDALRTLSRLLFFVGRVEEGEALASEAVELLERLPPGHELAMAYGNVSQRGMAMRDLDRAVAWGTRALALARSLDDNEAVVYSLTNIGTAELQAGLEDGRIEQERALEIARTHGLEDYAGRAFMSIVWCARNGAILRLRTLTSSVALSTAASGGLTLGGCTYSGFALGSSSTGPAGTGRSTRPKESCVIPAAPRCPAAWR